MMRAVGLFLAAVLAGGVYAQSITRSFGSVVFPGGTSATSPGVTRTFGSVVFPGGSPTSSPVRTGPGLIPAPVFTRPSTGFTGANSFNRGSGYNGGNSFRPGGVNRGYRGSPATVYAVPVYVPSYYDPAASQDAIAPLAPPQAQQPAVTVVYPPQQQEARPIIIELGPDGTYKQLSQMPQRPEAQTSVPTEQAAADQPDQPHYLIAFKDHTIYSAVAYWFDGDTLHYFTKGDTHNQASVSLLDRDLTERLNRELGIEFKMPAAK